MRKSVVICLGLSLVCAAGKAGAQDKAVDTAAIDAELGSFRESLFRLFNEEKYQELLEQHCHPDILTIWPDGHAREGHKGVLAEFDYLKTIISRIKVNPSTSSRLILNDGTLVVSMGDLRDDYTLREGGGIDVSLNSHWTATLIKQDGRWLMLDFNCASNSFENPVIDLRLKAARLTTGAATGIGGLLLGVVVAMFARRKKRGEGLQP